MTCRQWKEYSIKGAEAELRAHAEKCADCGRRLADLEILESGLAYVAKEQNETLPSPAVERERDLFERLELQPKGALLCPVIWVPAAGLVLLALFVLLLGPTGEEGVQPDPVPVDTVGPFTVMAIDDHGRITESISSGEIVAPDKSRVLVDLFGDRVGLSKGGRLEVERLSEGVLELSSDRGLVACQVSSRKDGGRFVVSRGEFKVEVVGTRFSVDSDSEHSLVVLVEEGRVKVHGPDGLLELVRAGETLSILSPSNVLRSRAHRDGLDSMDQLLSLAMVSEPVDASVGPSRTEEHVDAATAVPAGRDSKKKANLMEPTPLPAIEPNYSGWKQMIIQGEHAGAEKELTAYLKHKPRDANAHWLLATCRRKMGNWEGTVEAYEKVIETGGELRKDQARFRIATIMQDKLRRHGDALRYLNRFLRDAPPLKPLRAEALLRKGESLKALGRNAEAQKVLEALVAQYPGKPASVKAKRLLEGLD